MRKNYNEKGSNTHTQSGTIKTLYTIRSRWLNNGQNLLAFVCKREHWYADVGGEDMFDNFNRSKVILPLHPSHPLLPSINHMDVVEGGGEESSSAIAHTL